MLGLLRGNEDQWGSATIVVLLAVAAVALVTFVVVEARSAAPMVPLSMFRSPSFAGAQVAALAISASLFAVFLCGTLYLQQVLGLLAVDAGLVYIPGTVLNLLTAGATANLSSRVHRGSLITGGLFLVAAGMIGMTAAGAGSPWAIFVLGFTVAMVGTGMFYPASALSRSMSLSTAAGINDTACQAGIAVGVAALGALFPEGAGTGAAAPGRLRHWVARRTAGGSCAGRCRGDRLRAADPGPAPCGGPCRG